MGQVRKLDLASIMPPDLARTFGHIHGAADSVLSTGVEALDAAIGGGLPRGAITEVIGAVGHDGDWLALRAVLAANGVCAVLDHDGGFHPPGAAAVGVDLNHLLVVRVGNRKEALWALERLAREPELKVVVASLPGLRDTMLRRLQLAAESSGQALLLLRPEAEAAHASWGALRLRVRGEPGDGARRLLVEVLRTRNGSMPRPVRIEINDDFTGALRAYPVLSHRETDAQPNRLAGA